MLPPFPLFPPVPSCYLCSSLLSLLFLFPIVPPCSPCSSCSPLLHLFPLCYFCSPCYPCSLLLPLLPLGPRPQEIWVRDYWQMAHWLHSCWIFRSDGYGWIWTSRLLQRQRQPTCFTSLTQKFPKAHKLAQTHHVVHGSDSRMRRSGSESRLPIFWRPRLQRVLEWKKWRFIVQQAWGILQLWWACSRCWKGLD